jgi:hypothetical protein
LAAGVDQLAEKITGEPAPVKAAAKTAPKVAVAPSNGNPFREAQTEKRLKLLLWGDTGTGKTVLSLRFPAPCVIDMERGTEAYSSKHKYQVQHTTDANDVMDAVRWLLANKHSYRTLVIDPITVYWEALQRKWSNIFLSRKHDSKGFRHEFYDMQAKDWMTVKAEWRELMRFVAALDMNVIVTARQKAQYADGEFMRKIGETFDGEKSLPYLFDVIVRLFRKGEQYMAEVVKDRFQVLPQEAFPAEYAVFERAFGAKELEREANPFLLATTEQAARIRQLATEYGVAEDKLMSRVRSYGQAYGAETIEDLREHDAASIIQKFEIAIQKAKEQVATEVKE